MKSDENFERMVELWHDYQEMHTIKLLCPARWMWGMEELEQNMSWHYESMVLMIPIEVEWDIIQLTDRPLSKGQQRRRLIKKLQLRAAKGIENLHKRTFNLL
jgi:hypothetical protein